MKIEFEVVLNPNIDGVEYYGEYLFVSFSTDTIDPETGDPEIFGEYYLARPLEPKPVD